MSTNEKNDAPYTLHSQFMHHARIHEVLLPVTNSTEKEYSPQPPHSFASPWPFGITGGMACRIFAGITCSDSFTLLCDFSVHCPQTKPLFSCLNFPQAPLHIRFIGKEGFPALPTLTHSSWVVGEALGVCLSDHWLLQITCLLLSSPVRGRQRISPPGWKPIAWVRTETPLPVSVRSLRHHHSIRSDRQIFATSQRYPSLVIIPFTMLPLSCRHFYRLGAGDLT